MRLVIAITLQITALVSFLIWGFSAMFAPMLFAGDNALNTKLVFWVMVAMPVLMILASLVIWVGYRRNNPLITGVAAAIIALSYIPLFWQ